MRKSYNKKVLANLGSTTARGVTAAAITFATEFDPTGVSLFTGILFDTIKLISKSIDGSVSMTEFIEQGGLIVKDRVIFTGLTVASTFIIGPIGLIVPILVRTLISNQELQRQTIMAWNDVATTMKKELHLRLSNVSFLDQANEEYRQAANISEENKKLANSLNDEILKMGRLLGFDNGKKS